MVCTLAHRRSAHLTMFSGCMSPSATRYRPYGKDSRNEPPMKKYVRPQARPPSNAFLRSLLEVQGKYDVIHAMYDCLLLLKAFVGTKLVYRIIVVK